MDSTVGPELVIDQYLTAYRKRTHTSPSELRAIIMEALHLQGFELVHTGVELSHCEGCGAPFWRGGTFGRRADAVFCCEDCRVAHKNLRNKARAA
jgi:hypothetical protein